MVFENLYKVVNTKTREIKFFDSPVVVRIFLKDNLDWRIKR